LPEGLQVGVVEGGKSEPRKTRKTRKNQPRRVQTTEQWGRSGFPRATLNGHVSPPIPRRPFPRPIPSLTGLDIEPSPLFIPEQPFTGLAVAAGNVGLEA
jgi:hypothetical protein